ncbi:hypothetical protein T265_04933 [Opisthorchis viverrini]|uniref:Uncharacterized protein n=1 Tax=Opisthorchis viverrini TaxID=6198 RepID=A0A075AFY1_OPIVI|nr:hypothetical protein T265_04933 [Opisthorchis viverrini]KER28174.1 hypothetical protein T265_04933 [Opisthorchis viverrini]
MAALNDNNVYEWSSLFLRGINYRNTGAHQRTSPESKLATSPSVIGGEGRSLLPAPSRTPARSPTIHLYAAAFHCAFQVYAKREHLA